MSSFVKDQIVFRGGAKYRLVRVQGVVAQLENVATGEISSHEEYELLEEYMRGYLRTASTKEHRRPSKAVGGKDALATMSHGEDYGKAGTRRRIRYLVALDRAGAFHGPRNALGQAIHRVGVELNDSSPPHETTIYRWLREYRIAQLDVRALFCNTDHRGGRGKARLDPATEAILQDKIEAIYLRRKRCSAEELSDAVFLAIQKENTTRVEAEWLRVPCLRTIQRRISEIGAFDRALARYGEREAQRRFADHLGARAVTRILEIAEMDHTPIDLLVADDNGSVIGRPVITVVLDRFSRCLLGFSLSLAGYGVHSVFEALRHAMMPKTYLRERFPDLQLEWPCHGWLERVLMDNGREFHSNAVADAMANIGIVCEFAASRDPNDKPFVERFLKTLNYSLIHRLPGTTLAKVHERIGFNAEDDACLTLEKLNEIIHVWVTSVYHVRPHAGLSGRTPIAVWTESAKAFPAVLKCNADDLDIEFSSVEECTLQHYGIDLNTFRYVSTELLALRRLLPERSRVTIKAPFGDAGHVWVWDRVNNAYIKAENKEPEYAGLSIEQAKAAKNAIARGPDEYRRTRADAGAIIRATSEEAMKSQKLKERKRGARLAGKGSRTINRPEPKLVQTRGYAEPPALSDGNVQLQDFEIEAIGKGAQDGV